MVKICSLSYDKAIEAISRAQTVRYRHGVWNNYTTVKTSDAIERIKKSHYGADVRYDEDSDKYYVSIPCDSDMW